MKNFEHYEEQIKRFEEKDNTSYLNCYLWKMRVGEIRPCDGRCGKCFLETFHWLNEEYQEPKVVLPKKLATILSGLCFVDSFRIVNKTNLLNSTSFYSFDFYRDGKYIGYIDYYHKLLDIGELQLGKSYYLKDCDFTKGEE